MKSQVICDALNAVNPTPAQRARMRAALEAQLPAEAPSSGRASAESIVSALVDDHSRRCGAVRGGAAGHFCPRTDG